MLLSNTKITELLTDANEWLVSRHFTHLKTSDTAQHNTLLLMTIK